MPTPGRRPCPSFGPPAASTRARERMTCPAQMLWAPLPLKAVAPNDVLRLASASTSPIARPAHSNGDKRDGAQGQALLPQSALPDEAAGAGRERASRLLLPWVSCRLLPLALPGL